MKQPSFRKFIISIFMLIITLMVSIIIIGCNNQSGTDINPVFFNVKYKVSDGGYFLTGDTQQIIQKGHEGTEVTVVAHDTYKFIKWDDGFTSATRKETNVQSNLTLTAIFEKISFSLTYEAIEGGYLDGEKTQNVEYGADASCVTAKPDESHLFAGWSDGILSETRQDKNIKANVEVSAIFMSKTKTLRYEYNNATDNNSQKSITLSYGNIKDTSFVLPKKEYFIFNGWYLEADFKTKAADESGKLFLGDGIFFSDSDVLYAKWTASESITYKILMIFVDEVHANLETVDGTIVDVNYKMSLIERKTCELIPQQISKLLNEWFDGLVNFEIDTYFTTVPLTDESFQAGMSSLGKLDYSVFANDIPEIWPLLKNYRSIITTSSMNDYDFLLHDGSGSASIKYAFVNMESLFYPLIVNNLPLESYLDLSFIDWKPLLELYTHEFTHTVETGLDVFEYHAAIVYYSHLSMQELEVTKLYLLNQAIIEDKKIGIPFDYWIGNITVRANYVADIGGTVNGESSVVLDIQFGSDAEEITAVADDGYRFIGWSDGVLTATRHDTNLTSYLTVRAIFIKDIE